jgi:hypothetical protein
MSDSTVDLNRLKERLANLGVSVRLDASPPRKLASPGRAFLKVQGRGLGRCGREFRGEPAARHDLAPPAPAGQATRASTGAKVWEACASRMVLSHARCTHAGRTRTHPAHAVHSAGTHAITPCELAEPMAPSVHGALTHTHPRIVGAPVPSRPAATPRHVGAGAMWQNCWKS